MPRLSKCIYPCEGSLLQEDLRLDLSVTWDLASVPSASGSIAIQRFNEQCYAARLERDWKGLLESGSGINRTLTH